MRLLASITFLIGLLTTNASIASTFWVAAAGGNTGDCRTAVGTSDPGIYVRTVSHGLSCAGLAGTAGGAGDTVIVKSGIYTESLFDQIPSGSSWNAPFVLKCEMSRTCTIRAGNTAAISFNTPSRYIEVRGFIIDGENNSASGGIDISQYTLGGHHDIRIVDNEIRAMGSMGIQASGASQFEILQNSIHDVGNVCGGNIGMCHGLYVGDRTSGWQIEGNVVYNSASYGIHIYGSDVSNHTVQNNITHNNGTAGVNGSGIIVGGPGMRVGQNISYSNAYSGIQLSYSNCSGMLLYNNTTWNNNEVGIYDVNCFRTIIKNNLAIENAQGGIRLEGSASTISHNLTTGTAAENFVNAAAGDFSLVPTSPAIRAGTPELDLNIVLPAAPNIGAFILDQRSDSLDDGSRSTQTRISSKARREVRAAAR